MRTPHRLDNPSTTIRSWDENGNCVYCRTDHKSFHDHEYQIEYVYANDRLYIGITNADGIFGAFEANPERWKISQNVVCFE